jgi:hypothetical protein
MPNLIQLVTLLQPDMIAREFVATLTHASAMAFFAWMMRPKPRNKP